MRDLKGNVELSNNQMYTVHLYVISDFSSLLYVL